MNTCVILNPNAGSAEQGQALHELLADTPSFTLRETRQEGDGDRFAQEAAAEGFECIVAAGGDGTIHEVACGILRAGSDAVLGILPLGTGNDLVRTLTIPTDLHEAIVTLREGVVQALDVIEVRTEAGTTFALNACAGGFSGQVDEALTTEMKKTWGPLAFLLGAIEALPDLTDYRTRLWFDDGDEEVLQVFNIVIANARTIGGGKPVAPTANPEDGLMDVVLVERGTALEMAEVSTRLIAGTWLESPKVEHRRARQVRIEAEPGMWFNVDGELFTREPVTFTVRPRALHVLVGPEYQAKVEGEMGK